MFTWHLTFSADGRQAFYPTEDGAMAGVQALVRIAGPYLAAFCVVDEHVHTVPVANEADLAHLRRSLVRSLRSTTAVPVLPAHVRHVDTRRYLEWLIDYVLLQPLKHRQPGHPAPWPGSCFLDLVGARHLPGLDLQLARVLPRYRLRSAFETLALGSEPLSPTPDEEARWLPTLDVVAAAARATGAPPALAGRSTPEVRARRTAAQLLTACGASPKTLADALRRTRQGVHQLLARPAHPRDLSALRLRLALEARVQVTTPQRSRSSSSR